MGKSNETPGGFWGNVARKAKAILDDDDPSEYVEAPRAARQHGYNVGPRQQEDTRFRPSENPKKPDKDVLRKGFGALASSFTYLGNALEEGLTIVENRTADIIQETRNRRLNVRKKAAPDLNRQTFDAGNTREPSEIHRQPFDVGYTREPSGNRRQPFDAGYTREPSGNRRQPFDSGYTREPSGNNRQPFDAGHTREPSGNHRQPFEAAYPMEPSGNQRQPFDDGYTMEPSGNHRQPIDAGYTRKPSKNHRQPFDAGYTREPAANQVPAVAQTEMGIQLQASRDVAMAMAAKTKLLLRELKTVKADLAFAKERCAQLEEENKILREGMENGNDVEDDDLVRLQLETLLTEKARLNQENADYARENRFLREVVEYHQLKMQDVVYLNERNEEVIEVYPAEVPELV